MSHLHHYKLKLDWAGHNSAGTSNVRTYDRSHTVTINGKPALQLTTDNPAVGDASKLNPEDLLVSSVASCHMLSYLYACALAGVVVVAYTDEATGTMIDNGADGGHFQEITLHPIVTVSEPSMVEKAIAMHHEAHRICYIANSLNFEVRCSPTCHVINAQP